MQAAQAKDVEGFDAAFFGHVGFIFQNAARSLLLALTGGKLASVPAGGVAGRALQRLSRQSASFTLVSDFAMGTLGGSLKRKEMLSGRLADALAWMYVGSAATKKFVSDQSPARDRELVRWATEEAAHQTQEALRGLIDNLPNRPAAWLLRVLVFPLGASLRPPSDRLCAKIARSVLDGGETRTTLTRDIFVPPESDPGLGRLERALRLTAECATSRQRIHEAIKAKVLPRKEERELYGLAVEKSVITPGQASSLREAAEARWDAVQVDAFDPPDYRALRG
jgi:acyl-CoA dehydrogenase